MLEWLNMLGLHPFKERRPTSCSSKWSILENALSFQAGSQMSRFPLPTTSTTSSSWRPDCLKFTRTSGWNFHADIMNNKHLPFRHQPNTSMIVQNWDSCLQTPFELFCNLPLDCYPALAWSTLSFANILSMDFSLQAGGTGQLSTATAFANFAGCIARIFTSLQEGGGAAMVRGYVLGRILH